ncbi:LisH [Phytophthora infestans]|uniref:LisH n=1 Tax=Phytophthora infestans TaxID=4787 RepID=A0A8S9TZ85_PHYIN|nr:LisH [Phytophthora infestans]
MARDKDGKPLMSLEAMKEEMFQSIRDDGTVELIRAQLRRQFIEKLQQQRRRIDDRDEENNAWRANQDAVSSTPDEKLVHGLVAEYLASKGLENTLAVFVPEIGGARNQVDSATILEILHVSSDIQDKLKLERASTGHSLLFVLVKELIRRFQLATMDSGTQTAMDCFDHRIVLENELRRVENSYLAECAAQKLEPQKSLEERMVQYQREYDDICEKRLREELERYKSTEVALVRAEERKRFTREVDNLRASLLQEYRNKQERLQEHERELETAFAARRTELETSLFETRQSLFKDMERLRVKEAELQVKTESDFRHFASETQRFQLWEESVCTQEANLEAVVAQTLREKERAWNIERQQALNDIQTKQDELAERERALATETGTLKTMKTQVAGLQQEVAVLEAALSKSGDELRIAQSSALQLDKTRQRLEERVTELETQLSEHKSNVVDINTTNACLTAEKTLVSNELSRYKLKNAEIKEQMKSFAAEVKSLQRQILDMKLNEANAIVAERKRFMQVIDEERERSQWKENELVLKLREMQSRLAESEAQAEKYQSQYEDEKVHVESLRHDVSSLSSLLTQAQATINAKHGAARDTVSFRAQRASGNDSSDLRGGERAFMMKMMEMMTNLQQDRDSEYINARQRPSTLSHTSQVDDEEEKQLKEERERIERELTEKREYEKKRAEEEKFREELQRQRAAEQEAAELEKRLAEQRLADEKQRLVEEASRERRLAEEQKLNEELEEQRRQQLEDELAAKRREEREAEEERLRQQRQAQEEERLRQELQAQEEERLRQELQAQEEERIRFEQEQADALQAAIQKQAEEDRRQEEVAEIERTREEAEETEEELKKEQDKEETLWELTAEDDDADLCYSEEKSDAVALQMTVEIAPMDNAEEDTTSDAHCDNEQVAEESIASSGSQNSVEGDDIAATPAQDPLPKTPEEEEQERQQAAEEAKKKEDEDAIDVYRQRVLARKAAEKQRQLELAAEHEREAKEEEERQRAQLLDASESDQELELSGGSFAESSAASNSDSF